MKTRDVRGARLSLAGLKKSYKNQVAVQDIDLDVEPGEFISLLGPSGSGKTTTLNMVAGFVDVEEGQIHCDATDISQLPPHRRDIGMVFQNYALFPHMTAAQNIAFPLQQRKIKKDEIRERVESALEQVHLQGYADRYPAQLSGGQQQRVALARAIVFEPRLLLMDEPLGALDKNLRESLQREIRRIHGELGVTILFVTHDQDEALAMSDRIAVFNQGRIEQIGTASELYEKPATRFVAEFLGDSNILSGPGRRSDGTITINIGGDYVSCLAIDDDLPNAVLPSVELLVRPENCRVLQRDLPENDPGTNRLNGVVHDVIYLGPTRKIEVDVPGAGRLVARQPAHEGAHVATGNEVVFTWPLSNGVVLACEEAASAPTRSAPDHRVSSDQGVGVYGESSA